MTTTRVIRYLLTAVLLLTSSLALAQQDEDVNMRFIESNGIKLRIAEMGEGPLVILVHGWPESWYSWRHQMPAIAAAGYRVVAPDMRGYGKSDKPRAVEDYDIRQLTADLAGLVDALGEEQAILMGHDWGSIVTWNAMLLYPETFTALVSMSVPYSGRGPMSPIDAMRAMYKDNFFYIVYFQEWNVAEREFDADPEGILSRLYASPDTPREPPVVSDPKRSAGGWIPRLGKPTELPDWLTREDLDYYVSEFEQAGFRGGINYYRNFHRNWEITPELSGAKVTQPVIFIAGEKDVVIRGASVDQLKTGMGAHVSDLRAVHLIPEVGHWVQQEAAEKTNEIIVDFLNSLK